MIFSVMLRKTLQFLAGWIILPAALAALLFRLGAGFPAICLYAFYLLLLFARIMTHMWLAPLKCERDLSAEVVSIGESVRAVVKITNPNPWPILWLYVQETLPEKIQTEGVTRRLLYMPPRHALHLYYSMKMTRRGCHALGPLVFESGDVFGLFRKTRVDKKRDFVTVTPRYDLIEDFQPGQRRLLGNYAARRSVFDDPTRISGVREYRPGDPLKRVHWKSSAHTGLLHSKIYEPVTEAGAAVILDFHEDSWTQEALPEAMRGTQPLSEEALVYASSLCRYLWDGGWKLGFLSNGRDPLGLPGFTVSQARSSDSLSTALEAARRGSPDDRLEPVFIPARKSPDQFPVIHENLGRIVLTDGLSIVEALDYHISRIEREQVLVLITGAAEEDFIAGVMRWRSLGYRVMLFIVKNETAHDRAFHELTAAGAEVYNVNNERRLADVATGRRFF